MGVDTGGVSAPATSTRPIALLSAAAFCVAGCLRITDPLLPQLARDFGVSTGQASVVVTAFALAYGTCQLLYGPIGDRLGKYRVVCVTMAASAVVIAAGAASTSLFQLAALRLLAGVTTAGFPQRAAVARGVVSGCGSGVHASHVMCGMAFVKPCRAFAIAEGEGMA